MPTNLMVNYGGSFYGKENVIRNKPVGSCKGQVFYTCNPIFSTPSLEEAIVKARRYGYKEGVIEQTYFDDNNAHIRLHRLITFSGHPQHHAYYVYSSVPAYAAIAAIISERKGSEFFYHISAPEHVELVELKFKKSEKYSDPVNRIIPGANGRLEKIFETQDLLRLLQIAREAGYTPREILQDDDGSNGHILLRNTEDRHERITSHELGTSVIYRLSLN